MQEERAKSMGLLEVVYVILLIALLAFVVFSAARPRIGLVDVTRLTTELGIKSRLTADAKGWEQEAREELAKLQQDFAAQRDRFRERLAQAATEKERTNIQLEFNEVTARFQQEARAIRDRLTEHGKEAFLELRARLQPSIDEVARDRRLWMVLDRSAGVLYAVRQTDITDEVIKRARVAFAKEFEAASSTMLPASLTGDTATAQDTPTGGKQ